MGRILLVANPNASRFTGHLHRQIFSMLSERHEVTPEWPEGPTEARQAAEKAAVNGYDVAVAMGGDGVVHHVADGLAGSNTALGIIPAGTTNVLARILGIPPRPLRAARLFSRPQLKTVPVPLARLRGRGQVYSFSTHATFAVGVGFDAEVVNHAERRPDRKIYFGSGHYAWSAAWMVLRGFPDRSIRFQMTSDQGEAEGVALMAQIHYPYTYFGPVPLRIAPAQPDKLEILLLEEIGLRTALSVAGRAVIGSRLDHRPEVRLFTGVQRLQIHSDTPVRAQADGELLGLVHELEIEIVADRLMAVVNA